MITTFKYPFTGTGAIAETALAPAIGQHRELLSITAHFNGDPGVEDLTITLNAVAGAVYDTLLKTQPMSGVIDFIWGPDVRIILEPGDAIDLAMTGAGGKIYGIQVTMVEVS
ncbi:MAG: hypothetical protein KAJ19_26705 [Gammaproteobacteria bacterium]|nr:hypothetical protein [Gammaproteobacteria bacterium]